MGSFDDLEESQSGVVHSTENQSQQPVQNNGVKRPAETDHYASIGSSSAQQVPQQTTIHQQDPNTTPAAVQQHFPTGGPVQSFHQQQQMMQGPNPVVGHSMNPTGFVDPRLCYGGMNGVSNGMQSNGFGAMSNGGYGQSGPVQPNTFGPNSGGFMPNGGMHPGFPGGGFGPNHQGYQFFQGQRQGPAQGQLPIEGFSGQVETGLDISQSKRVCVNVPGVSRQPSDASDVTVGGPSTLVNMKPNTGVGVVEELVWSKESRQYAHLMAGTRRHWSRYLSLEGPHTELEEMALNRRNRGESPVELELAIASFGPAIQHEKNKHVLKAAKDQIRKWSRHWQSETKKNLIAHFPNHINSNFTASEALANPNEFKKIFAQGCNALALNSVFKSFSAIIDFKRVMDIPSVYQFYTDIFVELSWIVFESEEKAKQKSLSEPSTAKKRDDELFLKMRCTALAEKFKDLDMTLFPYTRERISTSSCVKSGQKEKASKMANFLKTIGTYSQTPSQSPQPPVANNSPANAGQASAGGVQANATNTKGDGNTPVSSSDTVLLPSPETADAVPVPISVASPTPTTSSEATISPAGSVSPPAPATHVINRGQGNQPGNQWINPMVILNGLDTDPVGYDISVPRHESADVNVQVQIE